MKNFVLMSGSITRTDVARFAYMKEDWKQLSFQQQYACVMKLVSTMSLSQQQKDDIVNLIKGNKNVINLPGAELSYAENEVGVEIKLIYIDEKYPCMVEVTDEEYEHYLDDIKDELGK